MSRNIKTTKVSETIQKHCKVCQDAGKPESEYRSHFTRETPDPNSRVVCPTLLALDCRYCFNKGHTVKYCPVLKQKAKVPEPSQPKKIKVTPNTKGKSTPSNAFACLDSDSEEENVLSVSKTNPETFKLVKHSPVVDCFPILAPLPVTRSQSVAGNYAAALMSTPVSTPVSKPVLETEYKSVPWSTGAEQFKMMDWAAMYSDSSDDEWE